MTLIHNPLQFGPGPDLPSASFADAWRRFLARLSRNPVSSEARFSDFITPVASLDMDLALLKVQKTTGTALEVSLTCPAGEQWYVRRWYIQNTTGSTVGLLLTTSALEVVMRVPGASSFISENVGFWMRPGDKLRHYNGTSDAKEIHLLTDVYAYPR